HRILWNFIGSAQTPAHCLILNIQGTDTEGATECGTRRYHLGLLAFELLIAHAAEDTEIAFFTSCKTIRTVHAVIVRRNLLIDCGEHTNRINANVGMNSPRLTILRCTGKVVGQVELCRSLGNPIALCFIDACFIRLSRDRIDTAGGCTYPRTTDVLQLTLRRHKSSTSFDSIALF